MRVSVSVNVRVSVSVSILVHACSQHEKDPLLRRVRAICHEHEVRRVFGHVFGHSVHQERAPDRVVQSVVGTGWRRLVRSSGGT